MRLSATLESGPTVLIFFRGHWCSYCQEQLRTFSHLNYDLWRHLGVDILPVTRDDVPDLVEMRSRFGLTVELLSDPDLSVTRDYTDIEDNARHGEIPVPTAVWVPGRTESDAGERGRLSRSREGDRATR